jgi:hypothetical protein
MALLIVESWRVVFYSITPDRYVLNKYNNALEYQDLHEQTHHFVRTDGAHGVSKQALSKPHKGPVLSDIHLRVGVEER